MELEELKQNWGLLDEQLKKSGQINQDMIKKMICERGSTSVARLHKFDLSCMYVMLACLIIISIPASIYTPAIDIPAITGLSHYVIGAIILFFAILYWVMARIIGKIDLSESLSTNIRLASRYKILLIIREGLGLLLLIPFVIYMMKSQNTDKIMILGIIIVCIVGGSIFVWRYLKHMNSIRCCIGELKSLKERDEEY